MTSAYEQGTIPQIEIHHRLRIAREFAGLDQFELAARMEVGRSTVSNSELGKGTPRRTTVNAWALACGVPVTWILTGDAPGNHPGPTSGLGIISTERAARRTANNRSIRGFRPASAQHHDRATG